MATRTAIREFLECQFPGFPPIRLVPVWHFLTAAHIHSIDSNSSEFPWNSDYYMSMATFCNSCIGMRIFHRFDWEFSISSHLLTAASSNSQTVAIPERHFQVPPPQELTSFKNEIQPLSCTTNSDCVDGDTYSVIQNAVTTLHTINCNPRERQKWWNCCFTTRVTPMSA